MVVQNEETRFDSDRFSKDIDSMVMLMSCAHERFNKKAAVDVPRSYFDGAYPMFFHEDPNGWMQNMPGGSSDDDLIPPHEFVPSSTGPFSQSLLARSSQHDESNPFTIIRVKTASQKEVRGRISGWAPHYVRMAVAILSEDGGYGGALGPYYGWIGNKWREMPWNDGRPASGERSDDLCIRVAQSVSWTRHWHWTARIGIDDGIRMELFTDPVGAQELFRLRDISPGKSRRDALCHWVSEHWRKSRKDPAVETQVRAHLRGATEFTWNGLYVKISPSADDLRKERELRAVRASVRRPAATRP